jgi:hypothetical protein
MEHTEANQKLLYHGTGHPGYYDMGTQLNTISIQANTIVALCNNNITTLEHNSNTNKVPKWCTKTTSQLWHCSLQKCQNVECFPETVKPHSSKAEHNCECWPMVNNSSMLLNDRLLCGIVDRLIIVIFRTVFLADFCQSNLSLTSVFGARLSLIYLNKVRLSTIAINVYCQRQYYLCTQALGKHRWLLLAVRNGIPRRCTVFSHAELQTHIWYLIFSGIFHFYNRSNCIRAIFSHFCLGKYDMMEATLSKNL